MDAIMMVGGLILLLGGGEGLVRAVSRFATRMRLPMAVVGAVVLGFGTSMPELLTSLSAAWAGAPGIAVGNVVGSNIANILLILGVAAVIAAVPGDTASIEDRVWLFAATRHGPRGPLLSPVVGRVRGRDPSGHACRLHLARPVAGQGDAAPVWRIENMAGWRIAG
jgi:cation:H+ antiporter